MEKKLEEALKQCQEKFLSAFRESPLSLTLTSAGDHRFIEVNHTFERITGWRRDEIVGRTPFDIQIWIDPLQRIDLVKRLLSGDTVEKIEFKARMKNGEIRICSGSATLVEINSETCILFLIADMTDLKRIEEARQIAERRAEAMAKVDRRLIHEQEEERAGLTRELHNYIERLMLLSVDLERYQQNPAESMSEIRQGIRESRQKIEDVVFDIQALSHRLYSSKLEYLGLEAAAASFCAEFSDQKNLKIDFVSKDISREVPKEVALCLFRVLQEALLNAAKHSGSQHLQVELKGEPDRVSLSVHDSGIGFDPETAAKGPGLGLAIVIERLKLVNGELSIESQAHAGTTIHAHIPLNRQLKATEAAS